MNLGKVVRKVISTIKNKAFEKRSLLLVQPLDMKFAAKGAEVLCVDFVGADLDEIILFMKEGSSVQQMLSNKNAPADAAIIGIVDTVCLEEKEIFQKYPEKSGGRTAPDRGG